MSLDHFHRKQTAFDHVTTIDSIYPNFTLKLVIPLHPEPRTSSKSQGATTLTKIASNLKKKNLLVDLKFSSAEPTGGLFHNKLIFTDLQVFISSYYCT